MTDELDTRYYYTYPRSCFLSVSLSLFFYFICSSYTTHVVWLVNCTWPWLTHEWLTVYSALTRFICNLPLANWLLTFIGFIWYLLKCRFLFIYRKCKITRMQKNIKNIILIVIFSGWNKVLLRLCEICFITFIKMRIFIKSHSLVIMERNSKNLLNIFSLLHISSST